MCKSFPLTHQTFPWKHLAQTQSTCYLLFWLFFVLPPPLLPSPQLHVKTASWSITPSPSIMDCWNFHHPQLHVPTVGTVSCSGSPFPPATCCWHCFLWSPSLIYSLLNLSWSPSLSSVTCFLVSSPCNLLVELFLILNLYYFNYLLLELFLGPPLSPVTSHLLLELFLGYLPLLLKLFLISLPLPISYLLLELFPGLLCLVEGVPHLVQPCL